MRLLLPILGALIVVIAGAIVLTFKIALDDYVLRQSLASVEVSAPEGWVVVPFALVHAEAIVNEPLTSREVAATTTQKILRSYSDIAAENADGAIWTFARGEELVIVGIALGPHKPERNNIFTQMRLASAGPAQPDLSIEIAQVMGVPLIMAPRVSYVPGATFPEPVDYRYFTARLGDQTVDEVIDFKVLTNSSDAAVAAAVAGFDFAAANSRLPTPDPTLDVSAGIVTPDGTPLATAAPRSTPAYRAAQLLGSRTDFARPWRQALVQIKTGEIDSWDALSAAYPDEMENVPFELLSVFEVGSDENAARYFASMMIESGRSWNDHEYYILGKVSDLDTTQSDLKDYLTGGYDVAPEVIALIARLPEAPNAAEQSSETGARATPSSFGQTSRCRIENGVRRCTLGRK